MLQLDNVHLLLGRGGSSDVVLVVAVCMNLAPIDLQALEFVRVNLGFSHSSTLAAGDSGNDIDMLGGKHLAVVVANAQAELLRWLITEKESRDPKRILAASQQRAAGIIEALETFGFK